MAIPKLQTIYQSIVAYAYYPFLSDGDGNTTYHFTKDLIDNAYLDNMQQIEQFVAAIGESDTPAFTIDRNFSGKSIASQSKWAEGLHTSLLRIRLVPNNPNNQHSEGIQIFYDKYRELGLSEANFFGNPLREISADGLLEGDLINSLVIRVREALNSVKTKRAIDGRKEDTKTEFNTIKSYVEKIVNAATSLSVQHIKLFYRFNPGANLSLQQSQRHIDDFIKGLGTKPEFSTPVGWLWKREHISEIGYRYQVFIFIEQWKNINFDELQLRIAQHWDACTNNIGECQTRAFVCNQTSYFCLSIHEKPQTAMFLQDLQVMIYRDIYWRLTPNDRHPHYSFGEMPKSIRKPKIGAGSVSSMKFAPM